MCPAAQRYLGVAKPKHPVTWTQGSKSNWQQIGMSSPHLISFTIDQGYYGERWAWLKIVHSDRVLSSYMSLFWTECECSDVWDSSNLDFQPTPPVVFKPKIFSFAHSWQLATRWPLQLLLPLLCSGEGFRSGSHTTNAVCRGGGRHRLPVGVAWRGGQEGVGIHGSRVPPM